MQIVNNLHAFIWESMVENNCNTYLIDGPTRILIDPGHLNLFDHVTDGLGELGLGIEDIGLVIITHVHPDHCEAVKLFIDHSIPFTFHEKAWQMMKGMEKYIDSTLGMALDRFAPEFFLQEGDLSVNGLDLEIFHTPGHSPGSVSVLWPEHKALFTGDVIFKESVGRTDLPGGNGAVLKNTIKNLSEIELDYILPGHGEIISGEENVTENFNQIINYMFQYI